MTWTEPGLFVSFTPVKKADPLNIIAIWFKLTLCKKLHSSRPTPFLPMISWIDLSCPVAKTEGVDSEAFL